MRKKVVFSLIAAVCVVVLSFACLRTDATVDASTQNKENTVLTVSQNDSTENKVLETRFLNMLNHNFVYNDAFYDDIALVNASMLALLDNAEESFLDETYLSDYIFNMYGKIYSNFDFLGENLPEKEGYVYIIPRGYETYSHTIVSVTDNADGSYTVISDMEISYEDGTAETVTVETLFLEAEDSAFGYNILYSEMAEIKAGNAC